MQDSPVDLPDRPSLATCGWIAALFLAVALVIYGPSLRNEFVRIDDSLLIYENPMIQEISFHNLQKIFTTYDPELYIPLTFLSYQFDFAIGSIHPFIYHLQNLLWHTANALLVAWLALLLIRRRSLALAAGLLFLVHPLHTEAVAWAAARKDVLSTFFFLSALIAYISYRARTTAQHANAKALYCLSLLLFLLGLLAKVMVLTLPVVLLLIDDLQGRRWERRVLLDKLPYFLLAIVFGIVALFGKRELLEQAPAWKMALLASTSVIFSLWTFLFPTRLSIAHPYEGNISLLEPLFFGPIILLVVGLLFVLWMRKKTRWPFFVFCFFLVTIAPTITNLIKRDIHLGSERYVYIPSVGLILLLAWFIAAGGEHWRKKTVQSVNVGIGLLLTLLMVMAYRQSLVWKDAGTLFSHVLSIYPTFHAAHNNLGNVYRRQGDLDKAEEEFRQAIASRPSMEAHSNLGAIYVKQKKFADARVQFEHAIAIDATKPQPYAGLGLLEAAQGNTEAAIDAYTHAIELQANFPLAYVNRGKVWEALGESQKALADFQKAAEVEPAFAEAHFNAAVTLQELGRLDEARAAYETAVDAQPWYIPARINLGLLLNNHFGDKEAARKQFQELLQWYPDNKTALQALEQLE